MTRAAQNLAIFAAVGVQLGLTILGMGGIATHERY